MPFYFDEAGSSKLTNRRRPGAGGDEYQRLETKDVVEDCWLKKSRREKEKGGRKKKYVIRKREEEEKEREKK